MYDELTYRFPRTREEAFGYACVVCAPPEKETGYSVMWWASMLIIAALSTFIVITTANKDPQCLSPFNQQRPMATTWDSLPLSDSGELTATAASSMGTRCR